MTKQLIAAAAAACALAAGLSAQGVAQLPPPSVQGGGRLATCLHGQNESAEQAARRDKAIKVAQAINAAEVVVVGPQKPKYKHPDDLMNVPALPAGFALQFNTDGSSYTFSIKDTQDACHFAIFSDQDKLVYSGTPLSGPRVVPLTTR